MYYLYFCIFIVVGINQGLGCNVSKCESCDLVWEQTCYQYFAQNKQWSDANYSCIAWGGELVSLSSQQQLTTVSTLQENAEAWTSLTNLRNLTQSGALSWADMGPQVLVQGNSSVNNTLCGYIQRANNSTRSTLELGNCTELRPFVCSKSVLCGQDCILIDGRCFYGSSSEVYHSEAITGCEASGTYLATIQSNKELEILNSIFNFTADTYWIGLRFQMSLPIWEDDSAVGFTNNLQYSANSTNTEKCAFITSVNDSIQWNLRDCNSGLHKYICSARSVQIPPLGLSYKKISSSSIELSWDEIPRRFRNAPIIQYNLKYYSLETNQTIVSKQLTANSNNEVVSGMKSNVSYLFLLSADTKLNTSPQATLLVRLDQQMAEEISTFFISQESASIFWLPFANLYQSSTNYIINITDAAGAVVATDFTYLTCYFISNKLSPNTQYKVDISSDSLDRIETVSHQFTTLQIDPIQSLGLTVIADSSTSLVVSWSAPLLYNNDTITHYILIYSTDEIEMTERNVTLNSTDSPRESYNITGIEEFITYSVEVSSYTLQKGLNGQSMKQARTAQSDPVGAPLSLSARPISESILLITWLSPEMIDINGKLTNFTILYSSKKENGPKNIERITPATDGFDNFYFILQGLTYGGPDYTISVGANNEAGSGPFSTIDAQTLYSGSLPPQNLYAFGITTNSISLSWDPPEAEDVDGIPDKYVITYNGDLLDKDMQVMEMVYTKYTQTAKLIQLEEDTKYTIQVVLIVSGVYSEPASVVIQTEDSFPTAAVQNLTAFEASQYSVLVTWEPPPFQYTNGHIIIYNVTTQYTDPDNTSISQLIDNFIRTNQTEREFILLRYLWYSVNFTVTVIPCTRKGKGPQAYTTFLLTKETTPVIYIPDRDQFITKDNVSVMFPYTFECAAKGNPIPLVNWYRKDGLSIPNYKMYSPLLDVNPESLLIGKSNEYICNASNRVGVDTRIIHFNTLTNVNPEILNNTLNLVEAQVTIVSEQAVNVFELVDVALNSSPLNETRTQFNYTTESTNTSQMLLATRLLSPVADRLLAETLDKNSSMRMFQVNAKAIKLSLEQQNRITQFIPGEEGCDVKGSFYDTEEIAANSLLSLESLVPKLVAGSDRNNATNISLSGDSEGNAFIEALLISATYANLTENITFPVFSGNNSVERVVVPSDLLINNNSTNSAHTETLVTTTVIRSSNSSNYNSIIALSLTQIDSYNVTTQINKLKREVTVFFPSDPPPDNDEFVCLFFDTNIRKWSNRGVRFVKYDYVTRTVTCSTNHLSSFAVLIQTKESSDNSYEKIILSATSYTLVSISFLSLIAIMGIFLWGGRRFISIEKNSEINVLYLNQSLALLLATGLFLFGMEGAAKISPVFCTVVAVLLQYTWTAVLTWCLCIGIYLFYRTFIDLWTKRRIWIYLTIFGWVFPIPFAITSIAVSKGTDYTTDATKHCFITTNGWIIWTFLSPIYFIIILNLLILVSIISKLLHMKRGKDTHQKSRLCIRDLLTKALIMTFVLGIPWVISVVKVVTHFLNPEHLSSQITDKILNWGFVILNAPVGVVLLIIVYLKYREYNAKQPKFVPSSRGDITASVAVQTLPKPVNRRAKLTKALKSLSLVKDEAEIETDSAPTTHTPFLSKKLRQLGTSISDRVQHSLDRGRSVEQDSERNYPVSEVIENPNVIIDRPPLLTPELVLFPEIERVVNTKMINSTSLQSLGEHTITNPPFHLSIGNIQRSTSVNRGSIKIRSSKPRPRPPVFLSRHDASDDKDDSIEYSTKL